MTPEQDQALRDYLRESIIPLIEQVLVKKLGQAMTFAAEELIQPKRQWVGLDAADWFEWWRTAKVLEHTQAEIDFADFLLIATAVQDVLGKKNGGQA
jgi:hypothetical protein